MEKFIGKLEKNIGFRIISIILTFAAILDFVTGDGSVSVGNIFLAGILSVIFVSAFIGLISYLSVRSVKKTAEKVMNKFSRLLKRVVLET